MDLIFPPHHFPSERVRSWWQIKRAAKEMERMIDAGGFGGKHPQAAALSHAQVSLKPLSFFVINKLLTKYFHGQRIIINARIASATGPVEFREGCMSYPMNGSTKTDRFNEVYVVYQLPTWYGGLKTVQQKLVGAPAFVVQHETDHAKGLHIYDKFNSPVK